MNVLYALLALAASAAWAKGWHMLDKRLRGRSWAEPLASVGIYAVLLSLGWFSWELALLIGRVWLVVPGVLTAILIAGILYRVVRL